MSDNANKSIMAIVFALVLAFSGLYLTREFTKVNSFVGMGDIWSFLAFNENSLATFTEVDRQDFLGVPYPAVGDSLLELDGQPATREIYLGIFNTATPPGTEVPIRFKHGDRLLENTVVTRSIPNLLGALIILLFVLRVLITAALILVGFWAFLGQSNSPAVRTLALFCYSIAMNMVVGNNFLAEAYATFTIPANNMIIPFFGAFSFLAPVFWLKLQLLFPHTNRHYAKHRLIMNLILLLTAAVPAAAIILNPFTNRFPIPNAAVAVYQILFFALGYYLLARNYHRAQDFLTRRQTRLVLWGSGPALVFSVLFPCINIIAPGWRDGWDTATNLSFLNLNFLFVLLIPIFFAWAFGRYRLLEVEARVKRGTRFLLVNTLFVAAFFGILYVVGEFLLGNMNVESRTPTLMTGIVLALGFIPAQRKARHILEEKFYPERRRLRALLRDFLQTAELTTDAPTFWKELEEKLSRGLSAETVRPVLKKGTSSVLFVDQEGPAPFQSIDELFSRIGASDHPLLVDELLASGRVEISNEQRQWFATSRAAVLLPLITQSGLLGYLFLGQKTNREDYSPEELDLLRSLAVQIALAAENIELLEEKIEKQKLEEQLGVARQIQEGLLPTNLPETPGLDIAARIRFCLNVAGDYYDVIPLDRGRTLVAIGDVAGKGVGAALLMSNLQASLRTVKDVGIPLPEILARINSLIHDNTPPELFITLFVALLDPEKERLTYVNAGHNNPILARKGGESELLSTGGLIVGVLPDSVYEEGTIPFRTGDTLLMYTDGASEGVNSQDEEFGEERIADILFNNMHLSVPKLLEHVEDEVVRHTGDRNFDDDFTLLAVSPR